MLVCPTLSVVDGVMLYIWHCLVNSYVENVKRYVVDVNKYVTVVIRVIQIKVAHKGGSRKFKQLCCYFLVGGHFESNPEGIAQYIGGNVKMRNIKEEIKLESLREIIATWLGVDCNNCDIKYIIMFDEKVLIDLDDEEEVVNLFEEGDYVFLKSICMVLIVYVEFSKFDC